MSFETELKLSLSENSISQLKTHSFWKKFAVEGPKTFHLGNIYYDTADRALNQARVALRIREKNGEYFQTLKTKGESINGLTRRGEWEWSIPGNQLDFAGLSRVWPESLQGVLRISCTLCLRRILIEPSGWLNTMGQGLKRLWIRDWLKVVMPIPQFVNWSWN